MAKKPVEVAAPEAAPKKFSITDALQELADAFEYAEAKKEALAQTHAEASTAISAAQAVFDAVKGDHQSRIQGAAQASDAARQALEALRQSVNERVGTLTGQSADPRVSVK